MLAEPLRKLHQQLEPDVSQRLSHIIHDVDVGKDEVVRTPFMGDEPADNILDEFTDRVYTPGIGMLNQQLQELEIAQADKFGPRSIQKPWKDRRDAFYETFEPKSVSKITTPLPLTGYSDMRPVDYETAGKSLKRTTSAGLPYLVSKGTVLDGGIDNIDLSWRGPCVLFTRTQEQGKVRPVWGYPIPMTLLEARYFVPYFAKFKAHPCMSAYGGPDAVDEAITVLLTRKEKDHVVYSEDYSSFDHTIAPGWSEAEFDAIRDTFQAGQNISDDFTDIAEYFVTCGITTPDGVISGHHGIPSGSMWTSVIGSSCHLRAQAAVRPIQPSTNQVMGDDGVSVQPPSIDEEYLADVYSEFNLVFNKDKTFQSRDEVLYLQRYYSPDYRYNGTYRGIYPIYRALNRLVHMERWTNMQQISGSDYFSIRAIAILENCKWHPLHAMFVKWVASKDKYNLKYTSQGLKSFVRAFQTRSGTGIGHQYSDNLQGIDGFETIKVLRAM
jgi:hypothetical protein